MYNYSFYLCRVVVVAFGLFGVVAQEIESMSDDEYPGPSKKRKTDETVECVDTRIYNAMKKYAASKRQLDHHGFPRPDSAAGRAKFNCSPPKPPFNDSDHKDCVRCKKDFILKESPEFGGKCVYHYGRCYDNVGRWTCCGVRRTAIGCKTATTHVHADNVRDRSGYVMTTYKSLPSGKSHGIYALDCEMSYTVQGRELTRVSIVDHTCKCVYDKYVKPYGEILSYNTEHSGVTEENLRGVETTLEDVQKFMLEKFSSSTIIVGHSLESDFVALRLIHEMVTDTSLVYTHPRGLPHKCALRTLARKHLGKNVQDGLHDSVEDASACMQLMMRYVR